MDESTTSDILDESERSSIRGTLMQLAQQQISKRSSMITIDAYMRECNIWIQRGMARDKVHKVMDDKLGLKQDNSAPNTYTTPASNRIKSIKCHYNSQGNLDRVDFEDRA